MAPSAAKSKPSHAATILVVDDLDVFAASGGTFVAHTETVTATVADGQLNIDFDSIDANAAMVSAIAVIGVTP